MGGGTCLFQFILIIVNIINILLLRRRLLRRLLIYLKFLFEFSAALRPQRPSGLLLVRVGHLDFHTATVLSSRII